MTDYNSKTWRKFRAVVPHKVRFFLAFPLFLLYLFALTIEGACDGFKRAWKEYFDRWGG